jgi:hypothetical protein
MLSNSLGSWSMSVMLATSAAALAMAATAAVSVLGDEQWSAGEGVCLARPRMGMRAVRAAESQAVEGRAAEPFPDACVVREIPREEAPLLDAGESIRRWRPAVRLRPLHEAVEVPENFV